MNWYDTAPLSIFIWEILMELYNSHGSLLSVNSIELVLWLDALGSFVTGVSRPSSRSTTGTLLGSPA
jgi:hypothetical protein